MKTRKFLLPALLALALLLALSGCKKAKPLELTGIFPADGAEEVPVDSAIELTFSAPPDRIEDYFTVEPPIPGRFQYMKEKVAFIPQGGWEGQWEFETTYTVTLKAGLPAKDGKGMLQQDHTFRFTARAQDAVLYTMRRPYETFLPEDLPVLDLSENSWADDGPPEDGSFSVEVYRLKDGETYRDELYKAASYGGEPRVETAGMTPVVTFTQTAAELIAAAETHYHLDIILPEPLEAGWYVASVTPGWGGRQPVQKLLQIQPSAVYIQRDPGDLLFWYNSTATGRPMSGASLTAWEDPFDPEKRSLTASAGEDGILLLDADPLGEEEEWSARGAYGAPFLCYALTGADGQTYYDILTSYYYWSGSQRMNQAYYGFLYTDRPIYHPSDTVKYWGVVRPRRDASAVRKLRVELVHNWGAEAVVSDEIAVSPDGVFTGELSYENLASGGLSLRVYLADEDAPEEWTSSWFLGEDMEIAQYKKPVYTAGITTDKLYYRPGEAIQTQLEVSLFDRTPAAGMDMLLSAGDRGEARPFTSDEEGRIETSFPAVTGEGVSDWYPQALDLIAQNDAASDVDLTARGTVYVFPTSIMMEVEKERVGDSASLTVTANNIDFSKIPGGRQVIQDYETLRGEPARVGVTVEISKETVIREELPPIYDRYSKKSIPRAAYRTEYEVVETRALSTDDQGKLVLTDLPLSGEMETYYAQVEITQGGAVQRRTVILGNRWTYNPNERPGHLHTFQIENSCTERYEKWFNYYEAMYRFGEESRYQVMDNGVPVKEGSVMIDRTQRGVVGTPVLGEPSGSLPAGEETMPDYYLCGAYFDGKRIYPVYPIHMTVDPESRSLDLQILPAQEDYRPGETAGVTVKLTDENGRPVSGGNVCLGVVDEAVFAVREQYVDMGYDLYNGVYYNMPDVSASYVQHNDDIYYGEGGKGGGGDGGGVTIRENFQDTAAFLTGKTGSDGTASFRVTMPDDLTQWRLTAVALDSRSYWGSSRSQLYTTLPFRIDPILSGTFLTGDTIACTVRGFGTGITTADEVSYTAAIEGYSEPLEVTAAGPAGKTTPLVFQKLPAGEYTVTVTARCGDYSDGVKKTFKVRESALTFPIHRSIALGEEDFSEIRPTSWPVELAVYPEGQRSFMTAWSLIRMDDSLRADHRLAVEAARGPMTAFFGEGWSHPEADISDVQIAWGDAGPYESPENQGAIRPFSYAEADPRMTARAAVAVPELVDTSDMAMYLYQVWRDSDDSTDQAAALMGSAALENFWDEAQQPQLELKARTGGGTVLEDLYLITGVSYLDQSAAQRYYTQRIAPLYKEQRGGLYLAANTPYETVEQTAAALACAVLTGAEEDAEKLLTYLYDNGLTGYGTMRGPCQLEAALYLLRSQPAQGKPVTVSYTRGGRRETETIAPSGCLRLTLTREDWQSLNLTAQGGAMADIDYTGDPEQLGFESSRRVVVTKTMDTPEDQKHLGGETTVTIKVELDPAMPYGQYRLVEWVPSNMRLRGVAQPQEGMGHYYYGYRSDEQLLTVDFYRNRDSGSTFTLKYTATSVLDTECTLERCYVYCAETMEGGRSEKGDFLPSDYYYLGAGYLFRKQ